MQAQDALGRATQETLGGGTQIRHGYNAYTQRLESIAAGPGDGSGGVNATIQNDGYGYDAVGNLNRRTCLAAPGSLLGETFGYDELNRLHTALVDKLPQTSQKTFNYDAVGNITTKSNVVSDRHKPATPGSAYTAHLSR